FTGGGALEGALRGGGIPLILLRKHARYDPTFLPRLAVLLRRLRPHIVHTHLFTADSWGRVASLIARVPVVVSSLQSVDLWLSPFQLMVERLTAVAAGRLIAVSREVAEFYATRVRIPARKLTVVYNGIDVSCFPAAVSVGAKRRELGVPPDAVLVGVAARLEAQKNLGVWLRAAAIVAKRRSDAHFVIAGDGSERARLESLMKTLGLSGRVHFLGVRRDIEEIIAACDLMAFSSRFEGLSLAVLESMASGKAVAATRIGGNCEIIEDGVSGLLVEPGDPGALADACCRLLSDERERRAMGEAARRRIGERFTVERMVSETTRIYEEELAARGIRCGG
ncbi:MAG: glycosyltransferase, partial [Candidatus Aureabacteria bacterium]|nr:glycosyltransferase [Candidatus Auribacterota bacterium]